MKRSPSYIYIVLFCSCQDETSIIENTNEPETIKIESLKKLLPLTESNAKIKAVFYNAEGNEIIFDFILEEELKEKRTSSKSYFVEEISGSYINESINDYSIYFEGSGNYVSIDANTEEFRFFISTGINQFVESSVTTLSLDDMGTPFLATYYDTKQLLDKEFEAVYSNFIVPELNAFSELYYNATFGIIGFKGREDDLYVFKEYLD